jgi:hypothetical protein
LFHAPAYAETDRHHVRPTYLCALLGLPKETLTVPLCSGCHDLAHHLLHHLINTGTWGGHRPAAGLRLVVANGWDWWQAAQR